MCFFSFQMRELWRRSPSGLYSRMFDCVDECVEECVDRCVVCGVGDGCIPTDTVED